MMTKNVLIKISGAQTAPDASAASGADEPIELLTTAEYYFKNGRHYLLYEDFPDGSDDPVRNTVCFSNDYLRVTKRGNVTTHLLIEAGKTNSTFYTTQEGALKVSLDGKSVRITESENEIRLSAFYSLDIEYARVADCNLNILIQPQKKADPA